MYQLPGNDLICCVFTCKKVVLPRRSLVNIRKQYWFYFKLECKKFIHSRYMIKYIFFFFLKIKMVCETNLKLSLIMQTCYTHHYFVITVEWDYTSSCRSCNYLVTQLLPSSSPPHPSHRTRVPLKVKRTVINLPDGRAAPVYLWRGVHESAFWNERSVGFLVEPPR